MDASKEPNARGYLHRSWDATPILYLTLLGSLGAYVLMAWLLTRWTATSTSLIGVVIPVIALALGALVRDERPAPLAYLGAAIVVASVIASLRRGTTH